MLVSVALHVAPPSCRKSKKDMSNFKIPPEYNLKIDFSKLVWPPLEAWVMKRVTELLKGAEDEVLVGTILESLKVVRFSCFLYPKNISKDKYRKWMC